MRAALRNQAYVCLDCRLRNVRSYGRRYQSSAADSQPSTQPVDLSAVLLPSRIKNPPNLTQRPESKKKQQNEARRGASKPPLSNNQASSVSKDRHNAPNPTASQTKDVDEEGEATLSPQEQGQLLAVERLRHQLKAGWALAMSQKKDVTGLSIADFFGSPVPADIEEGDLEILHRMTEVFQKQRVPKVMNIITVPQNAPPGLQRRVLRTLGLSCLKGSVHARRSMRRPKPHQNSPSTRVGRVRRIVGKTAIRRAAPKIAEIPKNSTTNKTHHGPLPKPLVQLGTTVLEPKGLHEPRLDHKRSIPKLDPDKTRTLIDTDVSLKPLDMETPSVPGLSFNLSRVLFNPGIYQLQDPRSRVFNFSPYLQRIMPVTEFNFDVLNEYITSSRDLGLRDLALKHQKKYLGSSSSMTGALSHFHFLLSSWRPVEVKTLSQGFKDPLRTFTTFQRGPAAIFLRFKDGIYAVDADKEYDSANILMSLGRSMEKLLTLPEEEFERYRKNKQEQGVEPPRPEPEAYHYTESGDFLLRSQLDAHDSRLPGTGMFDLKTRAVVSIRMNVRQPEMGLGYEIRNRFGDMESYEREYFDMIRSAFLKYSLQVRMGRMDGIFVAYHNIERIFGFQYVSLPEMDLHLHGTEDPTTGDTEFKFSLALLNQIFDRVTEKLPETSLRFHFETRDSTGAEGCFMYIFAETQSEGDVENIQNSKKKEIAEFEARIFNTSELAEDYDEKLEESPDVDPGTPASDDDARPTVYDISALPNAAETKADVVSKSEVFTQPPQGQLMGFILRTKNRVSGVDYLRPEDLTKSDSWELKYTLEEVPHDRALSLYNACRTRRAKLQRATQREDVAADYYLRRMKRLAENGRDLRKSMDKLDAGKPVIVLDRVLPG